MNAELALAGMPKEEIDRAILVVRNENQDLYNRLDEMEGDPVIHERLFKVRRVPVPGLRKSRSRETALSKTDVMIRRLLLPHNASSAPWSSLPSLQRSIPWQYARALSAIGTTELCVGSGRCCRWIGLRRALIGYRPPARDAP